MWENNVGDGSCSFTTIIAVGPVPLRPHVSYTNEIQKLTVSLSGP